MNTVSQNRRVVYLIAAALLLAFVLCLPRLAGPYPFSARMGGHLLLQLVIPALFLLSLPTSRGVGKNFKYPLLTWLLSLGGMWAWHSPALCNAALRSPALEVCQLLSLFAIGAAFWWPITSHRLPPLMAMIYLFAACLGCTILGIVITFAPPGLYIAAPLPGLLAEWQFASPGDQRLGGLLMWVPGCLIYICAIMAMMARLYGTPETFAPAQERNA